MRCSGGFWRTLFSLKGIFIVGILSAVIYYGWPIIEAILIMLPIPDPTQVKLQFAQSIEKCRRFVTRSEHIKNDSGYQKDFEQVPGSFKNDDDDDDENDVGRQPFKSGDLNYDSDDREDVQNLELTDRKTKNIPKLPSSAKHK